MFEWNSCIALFLFLIISDLDSLLWNDFLNKNTFDEFFIIIWRCRSSLLTILITYFSWLRNFETICPTSKSSLPSLSLVVHYRLRSVKKRKEKEKKETRLKGKEIKGKKRLSCLKPSKRDTSKHFFAEKGDLSKRRTDEASQTERKKDKNTERNGKNSN